MRSRWVVALVCASFGLGGWVRGGTARVHAADVVAPTLSSAQPAQPFAVATQWGKVLAQVEQTYVDPVDRNKLLEGSIAGMVAHLDPHSSYMNREEYTLFRSDSEGTFAGIGIEVDLRSDVATVIAPIEGGPAERAGLRSGDQILAVNGQGLDDHSLDAMMKRLRGPAGTTVRLTVRRPGIREPLVIAITRALVHVASVRGRRLTGGIGYLRIVQFQEHAASEFLRVAAGLLADLRSNPGGIVDEASDIADQFLERGSIYSMRARGALIDEVHASAGGAFTKVPVVVLVNEWSASASELLAGALQDNQRAVVVGMRTFGKGSVQSIYDLPNGAGLKLTTARYYTPAGHAIQADGVHPDVVAVPTLPESTAFGVTRERDLDGHLPAESPPTTRAAAGVAVAVAPGEVAVPRAIPPDPRTGSDALLKLAYETLLKRMQNTTSSPVAPPAR
jgi:carboxyl-terminal processing protease